MNPTEHCSTLWMGDIQTNWDETYVTALFAHAGEQVEVKLIRDKISGYPAGYGFVEFFQGHTAAARCLQTLNGQLIPGTNFRFRLNWGAGGRGTMVGHEHSIFVGDLGPEVTDLMLQTTFAMRFPSCAGGKVVLDPLTGLSKGFGFVRFTDQTEMEQALATMTGQLCGSKPIRVAPATKKIESASATTNYFKLPDTVHPDDSDPNNKTVFVGGIDNNVVNDDILRAHFSPFGQITYVKMPPGRGIGFVCFTERAHAEAAMSAMQGADIMGSRVRLSWGRTQATRPVATYSYPSNYSYPATYSDPSQQAYSAYSYPYAGYNQAAAAPAAAATNYSYPATYTDPNAAAATAPAATAQPDAAVAAPVTNQPAEKPKEEKKKPKSLNEPLDIPEANATYMAEHPIPKSYGMFGLSKGLARLSDDFKANTAMAYYISSSSSSKKRKRIAVH
mmetsp:Transcript_14527/g.19095  ORF Transcript_14527/g.19095 Transcript_14527/m.19095 type:complete len:446 (+) Transcript_14527:203-1540(+)